MDSIFGNHVRVDMEGHVAMVTINYPPQNYVSVTLLESLANALNSIDVDPDARAVLLQSDGPNFCAGADLSTRNDPNALYAQALRLFACKTPIIAAVQGAAVGAGLGLALVADVRIAASDARFLANFVKLGFHPGFAISATLPRLIGPHRAGLMLLTGRKVKPEEALLWGLVDAVHPQEQVRAVALQLAREIAANAPLGVTATRLTLRRELITVVEAQLKIETDEQNRLRETDDFKEGVRAVAERRPAQFKGR